MELESRHPAAANPPGSWPRGGKSPKTGLTHGTSWEPSPPDGSVIVLAGRAIRVPLAAVTSGIRRTVTVTRTGRSGWAPASDLRWERRPNLHGMQGVGRPCGSVCHPPQVAAIPRRDPVVMVRSSNRSPTRPLAPIVVDHPVCVSDQGGPQSCSAEQGQSLRAIVEGPARGRDSRRRARSCCMATGSANSLSPVGH